MTGIQKALCYISVESAPMIELAVDLYLRTFKAQIIRSYEDGSQELDIHGSSVLITTTTPRFRLRFLVSVSDTNCVLLLLIFLCYYRSIVELLTDPSTVSMVKNDPSFVEIDFEFDFKINPSDQVVLKVRDPFHIIWLIIEKTFSDGSRFLPCCSRVSLFSLQFL